MALSPLRSKAHYHARSVSLPSRSHPLIPQFDEHLSRLRASEGTSSSLSSIVDRLSGLEDLYDCLDDLLSLPHTQQTFSQECHEKWIEEALDGYLKLMDVCATAKVVFSQTKKDLLDLRSVLHRRRDANDFAGFLTSRKKAKKAIQKSLKDLKSIKIKHTVLALDKDHETMAIISILNKVETATLSVFESLLSYSAGQKGQSRPTLLSMASKLMHSSKIVEGQDEETNKNDFEKVDAALHSLNIQKMSKSANITHVEFLQNQLGKMELSMQDLEEGLECLLRRSIKTRVSLLNILNL